MDFEYILSKQGEWREIYERERRLRKRLKARAEKQRDKERKKEEELQKIKSH